ncbi:hypothetical protein [Paenibacillus ginsengarvi]|uniref:DUF4878 domain-containing protein n=1 Tax=Paenibacillus ginsengarvi TaxID=400777 RepID=A0A3B0CHF0_9BACL|nr:hypothetical protein [Paenibacillus ginsengarvi]RKN84341.1 hypothetical protein D7M11_12670 [Paenibacillus ginsengarvi]
MYRKRIIILVAIAAMMAIIVWYANSKLQPEGFTTPKLAIDSFFNAVVRKDAVTAVKASNDACGKPRQARIDEFQEGMVTDPVLSYQILSVTENSSDISIVRVELMLRSGDQAEFPYQVRRGSKGWRLQFDRFYRDGSGTFTGTLPCESENLTFVDKFVNMLRSL